MFSLSNAIICALIAVGFWSLIGLPVASRLLPRSLVLPVAPVLGWAVHSALMLPLLSLTGMSRPVVLVVFLACAGFALADLRKPITRVLRPVSPATMMAVVAIVALAALLAIVPMSVVIPKISVEGVAFAAPIFDHSKIAMIDEMARMGVPAANPFFAQTGSPERLSYYYLWHFSAAELAVLLGATGWEADAGLSWFTAFGSLTVMIGLATWLSGSPLLSGFLAIAIAASGTVRLTLAQAVGWQKTSALMGEPSGLGSWLFQMSWAPQHVASASCVVVAALMMTQLVVHRGWLLSIVLGLVVAAAYQSSAWVGGIAFVAMATAMVVTIAIVAEPRQWLDPAIKLGVAALVAFILVAPFLFDQAIATALREQGSPVAFLPFRFLTATAPDWMRRWAELPAYWLVFLPLAFPALYLPGLAAFATIVKSKGSAEKRLAVFGLTAAAMASLAVTWLLASTVGENNDLGWRAPLPAIMILGSLSAAGLSIWLKQRMLLTSGLAICAVLLGYLDTRSLVWNNMTAEPSASARMFVQSSAMWDAVRRQTAPFDRVANNPSFLGDMTPWPANLSWALLAKRRSCYAGSELALPFAPISPSRRQDIDAIFARVFAGQGTPDDLNQMTAGLGCRIFALTALDGAWERDPFAGNPAFRLVDSRVDQWRIYEVLPSPKG